MTREVCLCSSLVFKTFMCYKFNMFTASAANETKTACNSREIIKKTRSIRARNKRVYEPEVAKNTPFLLVGVLVF